MNNLFYVALGILGFFVFIDFPSIMGTIEFYLVETSQGLQILFPEYAAYVSPVLAFSLVLFTWAAIATIAR